VVRVQGDLGRSLIPVLPVSYLSGLGVECDRVVSSLRVH